MTLYLAFFHYCLDFVYSNEKKMYILTDIVSELQRIGSRSIVISDVQNHTIVPTTGNNIRCIANKEDASACMHMLENQLNPQIDDILNPKVAINCVVVRPSMKTRNLQKLFQLQKLREQRRIFGVALVEETNSLYHINGAQDSDVSFVVLHCAHNNFEEEQTRLIQRFCGTATHDKQLAAKIMQCKSQLQSIDELKNTWLAVVFDGINANCALVCQKQDVTLHQTVVTISSTTVVETKVTEEVVQVEKEDAEIIESETSEESDDASYDQVVEEEEEDSLTASESDDETIDDETPVEIACTQKISELQLDEQEQLRHLAIIDGYIEKLQQKRAQAESLAKKETEKAAPKTGWLSWLIRW